MKMYEDVQLSLRRKTEKTLNFEEAAANLIVHMHADYRKFEFSRGLSPLRLKVRGARALPPLFLRPWYPVVLATSQSLHL